MSKIGTSEDPRKILNRIADVFRGTRADVTMGEAIGEHADIAAVLRDYVSQRFVECSMPPTKSESESVFWEAIASILSGLEMAQMLEIVDLFFEVQDPKSVYHVLAPLLREVFFPSMLEPVLLKKIQSPDPRVRANAKEMDYFLFQARSHFSMSPKGRAQFDALATENP